MKVPTLKWTESLQNKKLIQLRKKRLNKKRKKTDGSNPSQREDFDRWLAPEVSRDVMGVGGVWMSQEAVAPVIVWTGDM